MENKNELDVPCRFFSDKNSRSNIFSKSLTTLSEELSQKSKNTAKGASGDKISKSGKYSNFNILKILRELLNIIVKLCF